MMLRSFTLKKKENYMCWQPHPENVGNVPNILENLITCDKSCFFNITHKVPIHSMKEIQATKTKESRDEEIEIQSKDNFLFF